VSPARPRRSTHVQGGRGFFEDEEEVEGRAPQPVASGRRLVVEADGGSRGNPGPAAYGAVVRDAGTGEVLGNEGLEIGVATNNVAEYSGLIAGLEMARASRWPAAGGSSTRR